MLKFEKGDAVVETSMRRRGMILMPGEQVSEVKWIDNIEPKSQFITNKYLEKYNGTV